MEPIFLPVLYKKDKSGGTRYWECKVEGDTFYTRYGVVKNREGHRWQEHKRDDQYIMGHGSFKEANIVALEHARSKWEEKKRNDAMTISLEDLEQNKYPVPIAPVLAMRYKELKERHDRSQSWIQSGRKPSVRMYQFPDTEYYWEYKYDGERVTVSWTDITDVNGNPIKGVQISSRSRNEIPNIDHIKRVFTSLYTQLGVKNPQAYDWHYDGELIEPGQSRNKMRSTISRLKEKHPDNDKIVIYFFDMITDPGMMYRDRHALLEKIFSRIKSQYVMLVPTIGKAKLGDPIIDEYRDRAHELGFEGVVGKDETFLYPTSNLRINEVVKYKVEDSDEYVICGASEGIDAHAGLIILEVKDRNDGLLRFKVTPAWSHDDRREAWRMWQQAIADSKEPELMGKLITLVFKYKNEYGKPEEARATRLRDPDDLS